MEGKQSSLVPQFLKLGIQCPPDQGYLMVALIILASWEAGGGKGIA